MQSIGQYLDFVNYWEKNGLAKGKKLFDRDQANQIRQLMKIPSTTKKTEGVEDDQRDNESDNTAGNSAPQSLVKTTSGRIVQKKVEVSDVELDGDIRRLFRKSSMWPRLVLLFHCISEISTRFSSRISFSDNFLWAFLDKICELNVCSSRIQSQWNLD